MVKIIVAVIIAIVLFDVAGLALWIGAIMYFDHKRAKSRRVVFESEYREAFIMECSEADIKGNPYAEQLDKCIRKMDKEAERLEKIGKKSKEMLSKMEMPEY